MEMAELYHVSWEKKYYRNHYHDLFVSISIRAMVWFWYHTYKIVNLTWSVVMKVTVV